MSESAILASIRNALNRLRNARLFRNNCGTLQDKNGRYVRYGIPGPGGSDLIGWITVTVTPDMVGQRKAIFAAVEVKAWNGRVTDEQRNFIHVVQRAGGIAGVVRSVEEAEALVGRI